MAAPDNPAKMFGYHIAYCTAAQTYDCTSMYADRLRFLRIITGEIMYRRGSSV